MANAGVPTEPRQDPWRRTSGIHKVRSRRGLGYVAELWFARDAVAARLDRAPGKILPDVAISELAAQQTPNRLALRQIAGFSRRQARRYEPNWLEALDTVARMSEAELPAMHIPNDGPPQARLWVARDPVAAARLAAVRGALTAIAAQHNLPVENLLTPDYVRRLAWRPPSPLTPEVVDQALADYGARPWQRELTVATITPLLADPVDGDDA